MPPGSPSHRGGFRSWRVGVAQRLGASRLGVVFIGRVVSPVQRVIHRMSRGRLSITGRAPVLLLTTTGRKSGEPRTVPLFFLGDDSRIVVCNVRPPVERIDPWTLNLAANPMATAQIRGEVIRCRGRLASDEEADAYWPELVAIWTAYERFLEEGGERSVFILEPEEADRDVGRSGK